jgi:hypothetical protein
MKFAKIVFWIAGAFGLLAIIPLYLQPGGTNAYYGLLGTVAAWQAAFFVIGSDPVRFRPLMIPAVLEKMLWMLTMLFLYVQGKVTLADLGANAATHGLLCVLFMVAFLRTPGIAEQP